MFVIISQYLKPLQEVDEVYSQHASWLQAHYDSGRILGSGRRNPPIGGLILAKGDSRTEIERLIADDPFVINGCAEYEIIEFSPNPPPRRNPNLDAWLAAEITT